MAHRLPGQESPTGHVSTEGKCACGRTHVLRRESATGYVHKSLQGTQPADLPVEQPVKFDLVVSLKTARALGLTVSESFLLRTDEVIE